MIEKNPDIFGRNTFDLCHGTQQNDDALVRDINGPGMTSHLVAGGVVCALVSWIINYTWKKLRLT